MYRALQFYWCLQVWISWEMKGMGSEEAGARGCLAVPCCTWQGHSAASVGLETGLARAAKPFKIGAPGRDLIKLENYGKRTVLPLWWVCSSGSQGSAPSCNQVRVSAARCSWQSPSLLMFPSVTRQLVWDLPAGPRKLLGLDYLGIICWLVHICRALNQFVFQ